MCISYLESASLAFFPSVSNDVIGVRIGTLFREQRRERADGTLFSTDYKRPRKKCLSLNPTRYFILEKNVSSRHYFSS